MEGIPFLSDITSMLTFHFHAGVSCFPANALGANRAIGLRFLAVNLTTFLIAAAAFQARDIKS